MHNARAENDTLAGRLRHSNVRIVDRGRSLCDSLNLTCERSTYSNGSTLHRDG